MNPIKGTAVILTALFCLTALSSCEQNLPVKETPEYYLNIGDLQRECRTVAVAYPWGTNSWPRFVLSWNSSITALTQMWDYVAILIPNTWYGKDIDLTEVTTGSDYWTFRFYEYYALYNFTVQSSKADQVAFFGEGSTMRIDKLESAEDGPERFKIKYHINLNGDIFAYDFYHQYHEKQVVMDGYYEGEFQRDPAKTFTGGRNWDKYFGTYL